MVNTSNIDSSCLFLSLDSAIEFVRDQLEMGFKCTIEVSPSEVQPLRAIDENGWDEEIAVKIERENRNGRNARHVRS